MFAILMTWALAMQVGITDPRTAPSIVLPLFVSLGIGLLVGLLGWLALPAPSPIPKPTPAVPMQLRRGIKVTWARSTTLSPVATAALTISCLLLVVLTIWFALVGGPEIWIVALATIVCIGLTICTVAFNVRVDDSGLTVESPIGFPRFRVTLDEIESASAIKVIPMTDFGGWGIRKVPGATGIILRRGSALEVFKTDGNRFVVTVADPQQAASLLMGLLEHRP